MPNMFKKLKNKKERKKKEKESSSRKLKLTILSCGENGDVIMVYFVTISQIE
jgi:hypothetical protein